MAEFKVEVVTIPTGYIVKAAGRAGGPESEHFETQIAALLALKPRRIVMDFSALEFLSSMGISALIRLQRAMTDAGGDVRIAAAPAPVLSLLRSARIDQLIPVFRTVEDAMS